MKNIARIFFITAAGAMLLSGCIKEIDPQSSSVTAEQAGSAPGSFDNFVSAITSSLAGRSLIQGAATLPMISATRHSS